MTTVYFVRHAEVEYDPEVAEHLRHLSSNGLLHADGITKYFINKKVDIVLSSPYKRAIQTVQGIAEKKQLKIVTDNNLRERKISKGHIDNFNEFVFNQWMNPDFKLENGESLNETRARAIQTIENICITYNSHTIVIGTHGTLLTVILNYYDNNYGYESWKTMKMPELYKLEFENKKCQSIELV